MKNSWFEKLLYDSYESVEEKISTSHQESLWKKINAQREKDKKRGFFIPYMSRFLVLPLLIAGFWFIYHHYYNVPSPLLLTSPERLVSSQEKINMLNLSDEIEKKDINQNDIAKKEPSKGSEEVQNNREYNKVNNSLTSTKNISNSFDKIRVSRQGINSGKIYLNNHGSPKRSIVLKIKDTNNKTSGNESAGKQIIESNESIISPISTSNTSILINSANKLPGLAVNKLFSLYSPLPVYVDVKTNTITEYSSLEFGFNYSFGANANTIIGMGELSDFALKRNSLESNKYTQSGGLSLRKFVTSRFFIQSGLEYEQIKFRFNDQYEKTTLEERDNLVVEILQFSDGTTQEILGTGMVKVSESTEVQNINKLSTLYLPLYLGYRSKFKRGYGLQSSLGILYGITSTSKGRTLDINGEPGVYADLSSFGYGKANPIQATASISIIKELGTNFLIEAGLQTSFDLKNRVTLFGLEDRYRNYSARIGIIYRLY